MRAWKENGKWVVESEGFLREFPDLSEVDENGDNKINSEKSS
jgi:hypothetical protein